MTPWLLAVVAVVAAPEVKLTPLEGPAVAGALVELTTDSAIIETPSGRQTVASGKILALDIVAAKPASAPPSAISIDLVDGSATRVASFVSRGDTATLAHPLAGELSLRTRLLRSVRFKAPDPKLDRRWEEILAAKVEGDVLVVRKKSGDDAVLDYLEGVIHAVTPELVQFEFAGDKTDVKLDRIEGLIFFQPAAREYPAPLARVEDVAGSAFNIRSVSSDGGALKLTTVAGAAITLPLESLRRLDYSAGKIVSLASLRPDLETTQLYFAGLEPLESERRLFRVRRGEGFFGTALQLRTGPKKIESFNDGLAMHARTELVFRLPGEFRRLTGLAGIDPATEGAGEVRLEISGDGRTLLEQKINGASAAVPLELDLAGVRRLKIVVDYGDRHDVLGRLHLAQPLLWK